MTIQLTFDNYSEMLKFCAQALEHQWTEPVKMAAFGQGQVVSDSVPETITAADTVPENVITSISDPVPDSKTEAQVEPAVSAEHSFTLSEVRAFLGNLRKAGHKEEVSALIRELGYEKFTEIPEEKFPELMEKARRI